MPGFLLHVGATVTCMHGGQAEPSMPNPRVTLMGAPTVMQTAPYFVAGCAFPLPPVANGPCVSAQFLTGSVRVTSLGQPLLLLSSTALCEPTGTPLLIEATQTRVSADGPPLGTILPAIATAASAAATATAIAAANAAATAVQQLGQPFQQQPSASRRQAKPGRGNMTP